MKYLFVWGLLFPVCCYARLQPVNDILPIQQRLIAVNRRMKTIDCDFTQYRHLSILENNLISSGRFYFKPDGMIRLEYIQPEASAVVINGEKIKIESGGKTNIYRMSSNPVATAIKTVLSACISGNWDELKNDCQIVFLEDKLTYRMEIKPLHKKVKKYVQKIEVVFDKKDMSVNRMIITESLTDFTRYVFTNKRFNIPLSDQLFSIP
jgi:outer membrane lipoprotein-sorting protein